MKTRDFIKNWIVKEPKAIYQEIEALYDKLRNLRFKESFHELKNAHELAATKKQIARLWTIFNAKVGAEINIDANVKVKTPKRGDK